jgi:hypothetical protein
MHDLESVGLTTMEASRAAGFASLKARRGFWDSLSHASWLTRLPRGAPHMLFVAYVTFNGGNNQCDAARMFQKA